jgi:hypothetical protein
VLITVLYVVLVLCTVAVLGVALAMYVRVRLHLNHPKRASSEPPPDSTSTPHS